VFYNIPNLTGVDLKIVVNENVPHPGSFRPDRVRMPPAKPFRKASGRFPYDLKVVQDPDLQHLVRVENRSALGRLAENPLYGC
jgi:hypothetical protein